MLELKGKYTDCKIFNNEVDETSISQVYQFLNHPAFKDSKVRFMPDIHAGAGAVIGTTSSFTDKVIPNVVGVDIGCGMLSVKLSIDSIDFPKLDDFIRNNIPSGNSVNNKKVFFRRSFEEYIEEVCNEISEDPARHLLSVGSLGGGNHFIEVGKDEEGFLWLTIHSGSRNFGLKIAKHHQAIAVARNGYGEDITPHLMSLPPEERESARKKFYDRRETIPRGMEYLMGADLEEYLKHVEIAQEFAKISRFSMMERIMVFLNANVVEVVESVHNYIDTVDGVIRKGAISAHKDEMVVIPWNMRDGLIIGMGLGNPDWNYSAPHGAGRLMSRSKAKELVDMEDFRQSMEGIYSTSVKESTLDESPFAYKDSNEIEKYIKDTVEIVHKVKPVYNFKAS